MKNPLVISTGYIYRVVQDDFNYVNSAINQLKNLPINGIELCFATINRLKDYKISNENLAYLKNLKYNSIHAPWKHNFFGSKESLDLLAEVKQLYELINARNVVFHEYSVHDFDKVLSYDFTVSVENLDYKHNNINTLNFLMKYDELSFTYDLAHAINSNPEAPFELLDEYIDKLIEVHISVLDNVMNHWFIHKSNIYDLIKEFKEKVPRHVPLVNEAVVWNHEQIKLFNDEIKFLNNI